MSETTTDREITPDQVVHLANLARIELDADELASLTDELREIVDAVAAVSAVVDESTPATSHPMPLTNVLRADEPHRSLDVEEALSGAPEREGDLFRVAPILDEE